MPQPWQVAAGQQVKQAPPAYPYEGPQAAANLQKTQLEAQKTAGTLAADEITARNQAISSGIKAKSDQIDLNLKTGTPPGDPSKSGQDYLASLPAGVRDLTMAMLNNRYPAVINRNIPLVNQAVLAANHFNPAFDAAKYNTRVQLMNHTLAGSDADELKALNTAITHAGVLYDQTAKLPGGADYGFAPLTHTINAYENWAHSTSPGLKNWLDTMQKYGQEESKTYAINAQGGQQQTQANYDINDPGKTIQSNIVNDIRLMGGRAASILNKYNIGNAGQAPLEPLSPDARAVLQRLAPDVLKNQFSQKPDPMAQAMGIPFPGAGGNNPPPGNNGNFPPPGITPAPSGPTGPTGGNLGPSSNGYNDKPDPQSEAFWDNALHQGMSYRDALDQWRIATAGRDLTTVQPPDPNQYNKALAYVSNPRNRNVEYHPFQSVTRTPLTTGTAIMNDVAQNPGGAFAGHYYNQLSASLPSAAAGDQGAYFDAVSRQQNPKASFLGDMLGTVGGAYNLTNGVKAAAPILEDAGTKLSIPALSGYGNIIGGNPARAALTGDSIFGGISGAAQNPDHPVAGGALGMGVMSLGNLAGRYIGGPSLASLGDTAPGQAVVNGARSLGDLVSKPFGGVASGPFNPPPAPSIQLSGTTRNALDDIVNKMQGAQSAGLPYMIADADPRLRAMLGSATRFSSDVRAQAENILQPRQDGRWERAIGQIDTNLAPVGNVPDIVAQSRQAAGNAARPFYNEAYSQPAPSLAQNPALAEVLQRPSAEGALRQAYNTALDQGVSPADLSISIGPDGKPLMNANPTWQTLHYVRQALDNQIDGSVGPGMGLQQRSLQTLRNDLDTQIQNLNPAFKQADAKYAELVSQGTAAQNGANLASAARATPEQATAAVNAAGPNLPYFQQGHASTLADIIGANKFNTDPYRAVSGSPFQTQNLGIIYPNGADAFATAKALEGDMGKTYQSVIGGSPTQPRAMDDKLFTLGDAADTGLDFGAAAATGTSPIAGLIGLGIRKGIDAAKFGMGRAKADAIAPFLMNPDPGANLANLTAWAQQNAARQAYLNQVGAGAGQIGAGLLGAPVIYGASQN